MPWIEIMMPPRFHPELNAVNAAIEKFNQYLSPQYAVPFFDPATMVKDKHCAEITHGNWNGFTFPNSLKRGVYFIFGREKTQSELNGLYIGKASLGSFIGARCANYLRGSISSPQFEKKGYRNEVYVLDWIASIDLDAHSLGFMAPSLEEYLITELRSKLNLLN